MSKQRDVSSANRMKNEQKNELDDTADWAEDLASYAAENKGRISKIKLGVLRVIEDEPRSKVWRNEAGVAAPEFIDEEVFDYCVVDRDGKTLLSIQSSKNIKTFFHKKRVDKPTAL